MTQRYLARRLLGLLGGLLMASGLRAQAQDPPPPPADPGLSLEDRLQAIEAVLLDRSVATDSPAARALDSRLTRLERRLRRLEMEVNRMRLQ